MSKSAKIYGTLALVLIGFPLFLALWSGTSAIMAILLIGAGAYIAAVCLLVASFWHRYFRGSWPIEIGEDPPPPSPYSYAKEASGQRRTAREADRADDGRAESQSLRYRVSQSCQGWLRRFSSNV